MESKMSLSIRPLARTFAAELRGAQGMKPAESASLIDELIAVSTEPERVYRRRWAVHDLVIWDNRCALHRVTIAGVEPTVVDGRIVEPVVRRREIQLVS